MIYNSNEPRKIGATYMTYNNTSYSVVNEEISKVVKEYGDPADYFRFSHEFKEAEGTNPHLMDQQVDALVITPVDYDGLKDSCS